MLVCKRVLQLVFLSEMIALSDLPQAQRTASVVAFGSSLLVPLDSQLCLLTLLVNCNLFASSLLLTRGVPVALPNLFLTSTAPVMGHKTHHLTCGGERVGLHGMRKSALTWCFAAGQTSDVPAAFHECDALK